MSSFNTSRFGKDTESADESDVENSSPGTQRVVTNSEPNAKKRKHSDLKSREMKNLESNLVDSSNGQSRNRRKDQLTESEEADRQLEDGLKKWDERCQKLVEEFERLNLLMSNKQKEDHKDTMSSRIQMLSQNLMSSVKGKIPIKQDNEQTDSTPTLSANQPSTSKALVKKQNSRKKTFPYESSFTHKLRLENCTAVVVGHFPGKKNHRGICYQDVYICFLAEICHEARNGQNKGNCILLEKGFPGVPNRKMAYEDWVPDKTDEQWSLQAVYNIADDPTECMVLYEGWDCVYRIRKSELDKSPQIVEAALIRDNFLEALKTILSQNFLPAIQAHQYLPAEILENPQHMFWRYEDLTYFHSLLNKENDQQNIFYISLNENPRTPPKYAFTPVNVLTAEAFTRCLQMNANKKFYQLTSSRKKFQQTTGPCETLSSCKCDTRFELLYDKKDESVKNLIPNADGTLNFEEITCSTNKILMECSDECGCSLSCPRRQSQRGQTKSLVVFEEGEKGFGLRAANDFKSGEYIADYSGYFYLLSDDSQNNSEWEKDESYEAAFTVMDPLAVINSKYIGNATRFLNHNCDANAILVETHSRKSCKDPLLPKISVYARKDIKTGQEITLQYCLVEDGKKNKRSNMPCRCGAKNCMKYFPRSCSERPSNQQ